MMIKSSKPTISIIIPAYNARQTIQKSIKSCTVQTLKDIEIICIDNNSKDNSVEIIKNLIKQDKRIKLLYEKKQGAGPARNKGLSNAKGEYIYFLDPDDEIYSKDVLERLTNIAKNKNLNIVGGSVYAVDQNTGKETKGEDKFYFKEEGLVNYRDYQYDWGFWRFIYNRRFLQKNNIKFPSYLRGQDTVFFVKAMLSAQEFYAIKEPTYKYNYSFIDSKHSIQTYRDYEEANKAVIKLAKESSMNKLADLAQIHRQPVVTIIIPIYNVEKYLKECLDSVINQTYKNLEIILVDDKSPDNSGKIADQYAQKDKRIKVIHKPKNEGLNMARATGFKASVGEYITFVDSDDILAAVCIGRSMTAMLNHKVDLVRVGIFDFQDKDDLSRVSNQNSDKFVIKDKKEMYIAQFRAAPTINRPMCVWGAIYQRKLIDSIDWDAINYRIYEDNIWTLRMLENADKGIYLADIGYLYRGSGSSDDTLSRRKMGNRLNNQPIGYLEYINILSKEYESYNNRYKLQADTEIEEAKIRNYTHRLNMLVDSALIMAENNIDYLPEAIKYFNMGWLQTKSENSQMSAQLVKLEGQLRTLQSEINSFLGIKRTLRLLVGNVRRRIKKLLR